MASAGLFILMLQLAFGQANPTATNNRLKVRMDTVVQGVGSAFINDPSRVGLSIGIVQNGQTYFYNFGVTEKGKSQVPTRNTLYEIGSISKTFTSLLLAQAILEKKVNSEDDIRKYLDSAYPNLAYQGNPIKLVHLANTTSGLPDNLPDQSEVFRQANPDSIPSMVVKILQNYTKQDFYEDLHHVQLDTIPGLTPRHSNVAAQLLGYILEGVYQTSYPELVKKYLENPLNMENTAVAGAESQLLAEGYNQKGNRMPHFTMIGMQSAGGLRYSTADMLKYIGFQLNEKNEVVKLSHQATWGDMNQEAIGFNWNMNKTVDGKRRLRHSGGTFGFASYCDIYPELNLGIVLLSNESDGNAQGKLKEAAEQIVEAMIGVPPALKALRTGLMTRGFPHALEVVNQVKKRYPELHLTEDYVNEWGYALLRQGETKKALELFKLNVSLYPNNWNTFDSLAEAYETMGARVLAIQNYQRSLALNPKNTNAVEHLKRLGENKNN